MGSTTFVEETPSLRQELNDSVLTFLGPSASSRAASGQLPPVATGGSWPIRSPMGMAAVGQKSSSHIEEQFYYGSRDSPKPPHRAEAFVFAL